MLQLSITFSPKKDLPPEQHDLYDQTWWRHVQQWDGQCWLEAVNWWIGHKPWMPKVAELREAYDAFLGEKQREEVRALPPPVIAPASEDVRRRYRALVKRHAVRGERLKQQYAAIVSVGKSAGLLLGSDALAEYIGSTYGTLCQETRWKNWPDAEPGRELDETWVPPRFIPPVVPQELVLLALARMPREVWNVPVTTAEQEREAIAQWPHLAKH